MCVRAVNPVEPAGMAFALFDPRQSLDVP